MSLNETNNVASQTEEKKERKPVFTICVLSRDVVKALTVVSLNESLKDERLKEKYFIREFWAIGGSDLPKSRSVHIQDWFDKATKQDIFMFLDADQTFTSDDLLRGLELLKSHDVVCGAYSKLDGNITVQPKDIGDFYRYREGELYYGATGFMFMTYDIVERIDKYINRKVIYSGLNEKRTTPFMYEMIVTEDLGYYGKYDELWLGEDYTFCYLVRKVKGSCYGFMTETIGHVLSENKKLGLISFRKWPDKEW